MSGARSKKLLLIRPEILDDDFTSKFSYPASGLIGPKALAEGWQVTELQCDAANRANIEKSIKTGDPDFIIHYNHGGSFTLFGQQNNVREGVLDTANVSLLSSAVVSTVSCLSALILGPLAIQSSKRSKKAYLGYDMPMGCVYGYADYFTRAANAANYALLEGKTFQDAKDIGYAKYTDELSNLLALNDPYVFIFVAPIMLFDREHLKIVLGDGSARAHM